MFTATKTVLPTAGLHATKDSRPEAATFTPWFAFNTPVPPTATFPASKINTPHPADWQRSQQREDKIRRKSRQRRPLRRRRPHADPTDAEPSRATLRYRPALPVTATATADRSAALFRSTASVSSNASTSTTVRNSPAPLNGCGRIPYIVLPGTAQRDCAGLSAFPGLEASYQPANRLTGADNITAG